MTTRTTTIEQAAPRARGLLAATAFTLAVLAGVAAWQLRPVGEAAAPTPAVAVASHGNRAPIGGLAELYAEERARVAAEAGQRVLGGLAELYRDQAMSRIAADETQ
jgi:hypothetical protein